MIIDGKKVAEDKKVSLSRQIHDIIEKSGQVPTLRLISVGDDPASASYIRSKIRYGEKLGAKVEHTSLSESVTEDEIRKVLTDFSNDRESNGIMLEAPLPGGMKHVRVAQSITPLKDVDCITAENQGRIALNEEFLLPATAESILTLIERQKLPRGSRVTIINRSPVIGRPLALMLLNRDYTVTVCHSKTIDLKSVSIASDVVVVGVGKAGFLTPDYVSRESIVIDAGINFVHGNMVGDADFESISKLVKAITPVPGGVGPLTTACLFENLVKATMSQMKNFGD